METLITVGAPAAGWSTNTVSSIILQTDGCVMCQINVVV